MIQIEIVEDQRGPTMQVHIRTAEDMFDLRDNHPEFHEGALSILSFKKSDPKGFLSHETPKFFGGLEVHVGDRIWKDPAGNFGYVA